MINDYELCINLWYCVDKQSGFVNALAGRGYYLRGTDEQKTSILKSLSGADFLCVEWQPVPERFQTIIHGQDDEEAYAGVVHVSDIDALGFGLFEQVLETIDAVSTFQEYLPIKNAATVKVPDEPLYVMTAVEYSDGKHIRAIIAAQDSA